MSAYLPFLNTITTPVVSYTLMAILVDDTYVQDLTHADLADVAGFEVSGTGYTTGGIAVTGVALTQTADAISITFDDLDYGAIDVPLIGGVIVYETTGDTLVAADIFAPVDATAATNFTYAPGADGFLLLTVPT